MILAAEYIPSPLQLMLVAQETAGIPDSPVSQLFGKRGVLVSRVPVSRFAGVGKRAGNRESPFPDSAANGNRGPRGGGPGISWSELLQNPPSQELKVTVALSLSLT